jgi:tetratricopeptide (TPR) repeat protein
MPFGTVTVSVTAPPPPPVYVPPPKADPLPSATQSNIDSKEEQRIQESSAQAQGAASKNASKNQSRLPGYVTGVIALAVLGGAGYWYSLGSGESIKATSSTAVPPVAQSAAVSPTSQARKDALNELISAAFDGKWQEVVSKATLIKSLVKTAGGNRSESEKLVQEAFKDETQDSSRAEKLVRKAIELDPSFSVPRFILSNILVDAKKLKEASDALSDALILDPTSSYGWVVAADIFAQTNRDALSAMRLALFFQTTEGVSNYWDSREQAFSWIKNVDSAESVSEDLKSIVRTNRKQLLSTPAYKP